MRYRSLVLLSRAGMQDLLTSPLFCFFRSSGHARLSCVTALLLFSLERVCETLLHYRSTAFFARAGMQDLLALPLFCFFLSSGHARPSYVTALLLFSLKRACKTSLRYRSTAFFARAGMRNSLTLPLYCFFAQAGTRDRPS